MIAPSLVVETAHRPCPLCGEDASSVVLRCDQLSLRDRTRIAWPIVRCTRCRLVRVDPMPAGDTTKTVYEGDAYGFRRSSRTDAFVDGRPHAERVLRELEATCAPGRLLDLGCATGDFMASARERGWGVHGVELSPHAATVARRRGLSVTTGTLRDARLPDASFDVVTILDVIEHLAEPLEELREVHRVLAPGGIVCIETPNWASVYRRVLGRRWAALQPRLHLLYFDARSLGELARRAGFEERMHSTEIVALLTPEGAARGFGLSSMRGALRDVVVRTLLRLPRGRWDEFFLRHGPAARAARPQGSFKALAAVTRPEFVTRAKRNGSRRIDVLRALNAPLDRALLAMGMGEQLRVHARKGST